MTDSNPDTRDDPPASDDHSDESTEGQADADTAGLSPTTGFGADDDSAAGTDETTAESRDTDENGRTLVDYVEWAAFAILCLLALVATFRFYFAASEAIRVWFSADFVPVFQALFNLVILVAAALGISILVRRIA